jgi:hypothetical protein
MYFDADGAGGVTRPRQIAILKNLKENLRLGRQPMNQILLHKPGTLALGTYDGARFVISDQIIMGHGVKKTWDLTSSDEQFVGDFNGDGEADVFIRSPQKAGLLTYNSSVNGFELDSLEKNTIMGDLGTHWNLLSGDQEFVGDFNGDGKDDVFIRSVRYAGFLTYNDNSINPSFKANWVEKDKIDGSPGTYWGFSSDDQEFVGDFNGDGKDDVFIRSAGYAGFLTYNGSGFTASSVQKDQIKGAPDTYWNLLSGDQEFVGDFNGDGKDDVFIRSADYAGFLTYNGSGFTASWVKPGTIDGSNPNTFWDLLNGDQQFVGDFNGDGQDDVFIRSAEYAGFLTYNGSGFTASWVKQGTIDGVGGISWGLTSGDKEFVGDFNKDGKDDILIRNSDSLGLLTYNESSSSFQLDFKQSESAGDGSNFAIGNFSSAVPLPFVIV